MATPQRFRSAFNGFNREDVVNYIEYLNNSHNNQIEHLRNQLNEISAAPSSDVVAGLQAQLDAALLRCSELEEQLAAKQEVDVSKELEAYRRAESAERLANERAQKIYTEAQSFISKAATMATSATGDFEDIASRTIAQLNEYQAAIEATVSNFKAAAASLGALAPAEEVEEAIEETEEE